MNTETLLLRTRGGYEPDQLTSTGELPSHIYALKVKKGGDGIASESYYLHHLPSYMELQRLKKKTL